MAASATGTKLTASTPEVTPRVDESLPSLFGRLGDDVMQLFDTKLSLLKVEIKEEANEYARDGIMIGVGGVIAAIGFALFNGFILILSNLVVDVLYAFVDPRVRLS